MRFREFLSFGVLEVWEKPGEDDVMRQLDRESSHLMFRGKRLPEEDREICSRRSSPSVG